MKSISSDGEPAFDVAIVGGGPAGLSAAYWLGRYRRRVRLVDAGEPRNRPAWAVYGYPGLPDLTPAELRRRLADQAIATGAGLVRGKVVRIAGEKDAFMIDVEAQRSFAARRVLLAYGHRDRLPDLVGLREAYGTTVHHCPDCDGPSAHGERVAVLGQGTAAAKLALSLRIWTDRITVFCDGNDPALPPRTRALLERNGIGLEAARIDHIDQNGGHVAAIVRADGEKIPVDRIFFSPHTRPADTLAERLGCETDGAGDLKTDLGQRTSVPGVYAAGDVAGHPYLASIAAAEGIRAALAIHRSLLPMDWDL